MSNQKRETLWTITIHKNDNGVKGFSLFDKEKLKDYLMEHFNSQSEIYYILHDKEDSKETESHIHLVIKLAYNNGKTFNAMQKLFVGCHLENCYSWENSVLYLTHESPNALKEEKFKYNRELVFNVFDSNIKKYYDKEKLEDFNWDLIEKYILEDKMYSILDFGRRFGYNIIITKWHTISEIIKQLNLERNNKARENLYVNDRFDGIPMTEDMEQMLEDKKMDLETGEWL